MTVTLYQFKVIWYCNDALVKESDNIELLFKGDKCSLHIKRVTRQHEGLYRVVAINSAGDASSVCHLNITGIYLYLFVEELPLVCEKRNIGIANKA